MNLREPRFDYDESDPDGFRCGMLRLGSLLGASETGTSLYELPPGEQLCPYHYEYGEEEWLLVLAGTPTLRHPGGFELLDTWDVVCFPPGPDGAHAVKNETQETVRVLMYSTRRRPSATVYPDSDKVAIRTGNAGDDAIVRRVGPS